MKLLEPSMVCSFFSHPKWVAAFFACPKKAAKESRRLREPMARRGHPSERSVRISPRSYHTAKLLRV
ncbi:MAG: hypothetical protein A3F04_00980 [Candidatus Chisholmbacteria bacterium RIFCSPHIGHO2_12_FULL_49_9]|uniref:Uncharacterized protein n=1 Tax=Candidatus Chisholmbacteria bacterium RIFCSPHIGHO2_01_FULL_52_32 TaxID=1797591 RepID=A0A1G1VRA6_9BACT|nr:MAG: hypothetical protein A2786_00080 [Candidatus Chisholmbacteria bacterium RIFCSPHIGHO2_01_FULL_52_32]OGY19325.1 MAG: hypothetical protein A3F04_00980 [Candidatus Chisholmbacteria bacterium RIFCSPHIGHO2_12_FULL_49_9]